MTANQIKYYLMHYWRFDRQKLCADEVEYNYFLADIIVVNGKYIHEIEVKVDKGDLCSLEIKKKKHEKIFDSFPHYFSFAVPEELIEDAKLIIQKLNPKYGLILVKKDYPNVVILKSPELLHKSEKFKEKWEHRIKYRLCSALIGMRAKYVFDT